MASQASMTTVHPASAETTWIDGGTPAVLADICELLEEVIRRHDLGAEDVISLALIGPGAPRGLELTAPAPAAGPRRPPPTRRVVKVLLRVRTERTW
jgi:hypothetical protein